MGNASIFLAQLSILPVLTTASDLHKIYMDDESYNSGNGKDSMAFTRQPKTWCHCDCAP